MTHFSKAIVQPGSRVNEIVADVLLTTIIVLAGILAVVQFAYY